MLHDIELPDDNTGLYYREIAGWCFSGWPNQAKRSVSQCIGNKYTSVRRAKAWYCSRYSTPYRALSTICGREVQLKSASECQNRAISYPPAPVKV